MGMPPTVSLSPPINWQREDPHWRHLDNSVNAVSFGFVATAILIFMFLVMAVFERFIRPPPPSPTFIPSGSASRNHQRDARGVLDWKLNVAPPSPKVRKFTFVP